MAMDQSDCLILCKYIIIAHPSIEYHELSTRGGGYFTRPTDSRNILREAMHPANFVCLVLELILTHHLSNRTL